MSVGSFGNMIFAVSKKKVNTFDALKRNRTANWKEHERYGGKALSEFTGPGLQEISFNIVLDANLGVKPRNEIDKWGKLCDAGKHDILVIGNKQIGDNEWKINKISETWNTILSKGELVRAEMTISLSEYIDIKDKKVAIKTVEKANTAKKVSSVTSLKIGSSYKIKTILTGYYTSNEAKNLKATNKTGKVYPGTFYVFNTSNGMINVTRVKGSPGSWINPIKNK